MGRAAGGKTNLALTHGLRFGSMREKIASESLKAQRFGATRYGSPKRCNAIGKAASLDQAWKPHLAARRRPSFAKGSRNASPKRGDGAPGGARGRGPRHANGCYHPLALRARRAPQDNTLARTACFGRAAPPGAPQRLSPRVGRKAGRPPRRKTASALPIAGRRRPPSARLDSDSL
jgi:hypothetical protein